MSAPALRLDLSHLRIAQCAVVAAAAVWVWLLTGCGSAGDTSTASGQTHPATTPAAAHSAQVEDTLDIVSRTDPPPGSEIESLAAPYLSRGGQPYDAEFGHITEAGRRFRFGLHCSDTGWVIHILSQPGYGDRSASLRATHRFRNARGELLVCWTGRPVCALDAYRVAVLWAEATCGYITAGRFDTAAEPGDAPAPEPGTVLGRLCAQ